MPKRIRRKLSVKAIVNRNRPMSNKKQGCMKICFIRQANSCGMLLGGDARGELL
jgi:hypothetical protein